MTLLYENAEINWKNRTLNYPAPSYKVTRKQAEKLSSESLAIAIGEYRNGAESSCLRFARGKQGGCSWALKTPGGTYSVFPMRDFLSGFGNVRYTADIQAGVTTDGQETRDAKYPWDIFAVGEAMEETTIWDYDGKESSLIMTNSISRRLKEYNIELQERMAEESEIVRKFLNTSPFSRLEKIKLEKLSGEPWHVHETIVDAMPRENSFECLVAFQERSGGLEIIPGVLLMETSSPLAEESNSPGFYLADTECDENGKYLNRNTIAINIKDGHTVCHKVKTKEGGIEVAYNGELEKALNGQLWNPDFNPKAPIATEKVKNVIEEFPYSLGTCEGLYPLLS